MFTVCGALGHLSLYTPPAPHTFSPHYLALPRARYLASNLCLCSLNLSLSGGKENIRGRGKDRRGADAQNEWGEKVRRLDVWSNGRVEASVGEKKIKGLSGL